MNLQREQIREAFQQVKAGLIQPDEAAHWLWQKLAVEPQDSPQRTSPSETSRTHADLPHSTPASHLRSVSQLIADLGPPPEAIRQDWDAQLAALSLSYSRVHGRPWDEITDSDILVDDENRLTLCPRFLDAQDSSPTNFESTSSDDDIHAKKGLLADLVSSDERNGIQAQGKIAGASRSKKSRSWIPGSVFAICVIAIGVAIYALALQANTSTKKEEAPQSSLSDNSPSLPSAFAIHSRQPTGQTDVESSAHDAVTPPAPARDETDNESLPLELIDESNVQASSPVPNDPASSSNTATMGLDSFAGGNWIAARDLLPTAEFDATGTVVASEQSDAPPVAGREVIDKPLEIDTSVPESSAAESAMEDDESDGNVRTLPVKQASGAGMVELPPFPSRDSTQDEIVPVRLFEKPVANLEIVFPVATNMKLSRLGEPSDPSWVVQDANDLATVAILSSTKQGMDFSWTPVSSARPVSKQLCSGLAHLTQQDGTSQWLFLRSTVQADAWPIDMSTSDAKAAWPLGTPPPIGSTSLAVEILSHDDVTLSWIQPSDPKQVRRNQSIVEFALASDPTIAIRSRIEIRTGSKLTLRVRHAAQLVPTVPWQMISTTRLQTAKEQVSGQMLLASADLANVKALYSKAGTGEKQVLAARRDTLDDYVAHLQSLSERLKKYDQLVAMVHLVAPLSVRLDVHWPNAMPIPTQAIFAMPLPAMSQPERPADPPSIPPPK